MRYKFWLWVHELLEDAWHWVYYHKLYVVDHNRILYQGPRTLQVVWGKSGDPEIFVETPGTGYGNNSTEE